MENELQDPGMEPKFPRRPKKLNVDKSAVAFIAIPLFVALFSIFVISRFASSAPFNAGTIQYLDKKKETVLELTAGCTVLSAGLSAMPGDAGTPIAEKLTDFSSYFLIVLCAIYLEKYLVTIIGYVVFTFLVPISCGLFILNLFLKRKVFAILIKKLLLFSVAIAFLIPSSVHVSRMIEDTYAVSIQETIDIAMEEADRLAEENTEEADEEDEEEKGFLKSAVDTIGSGVAAVGEGLKSVGESTVGTLKNVRHLISRYLEAFAVLLVTSCIIPILVMVFFVWIIKIVLGIDFGNSRMRLPY